MNLVFFSAGGASRRVRTRGRQEATSVMSDRDKAKVLLLLLLSLLPAVGGANVHSGGEGLQGGPTVGLLQGPEDTRFPLTRPEVPEEEEPEEDHPDPEWHNIYDAYVVDETDDHRSLRWTGRSPRSSEPTAPQPKASTKRNRKRKKEYEAEEDTGGGRRRGKPRHSSRDCRVERRQMKVRDLGLGYDSDEIILFKYCVGSCQASRTTYDLALKALLQNGSLPRRTARKVSSHPCCRPDRYESVSFMDAHTTWQTIDSLSAASCMCMG
ncbi:unnamed protein product [Knipowitschia caucasica]|uniref:TGF-beta family profile domain-containing protein n=1 Tax=Knipowitschia caucasica TaxID=637954 RepID=A0AAV2JU71_KNICA